MAPHLKQLQEKYKKLKPGDPKRAEVEKELMAMNKQQLGGCLPMLLQMPLLFAFLNMMAAAIELRGAPWILWITGSIEGRSLVYPSDPDGRGDVRPDENESQHHLIPPRQK